MPNVISLRERLEMIVDESYRIMCNKIATDEFTIPNEASMQLQLGLILKQLGKLYEFSSQEHFYVEFESVQEISQTAKSKNGKGRCDINLTFTSRDITEVVAIELKFLKKDKNEAVTDSKFSVYCDIENLENYQKNNPNLLCYEIVYTNNPNYTLVKDTKMCIGSGAVLLPGKYSYTQNRKITLCKEHHLQWDVYNNKHCFLKVKF